MERIHKRVFARNQSLGSPTYMQEPLHKQARDLKYFSLCFNTFFGSVHFYNARYSVMISFR